MDYKVESRQKICNQCGREIQWNIWRLLVCDAGVSLQNFRYFEERNITSSSVGYTTGGGLQLRQMTLLSVDIEGA